jgi:hypothetical protein
MKRSNFALLGLALRGDDVVLGYAGPDKIRGGDDNDQQYGSRGNGIFYHHMP